MKKTACLMGTVLFSVIFLLFSVLSVMTISSERVITTTLENGDITANTRSGAGIRISQLEGMDNSDIKIASKSVQSLNLDASVSVYDFSVSEKSSFDTLLEIRVPYDASKVEQGQSVEECVVAGYYDEANGKLIPVIYDIDEQNSQVVIATDHLSPYAAVTFSNKQKRNEQCGAFPLPDMFSSVVPNDVAYKKVVNKLESGKQIDDSDAYEVGFNTFNFYLGLSSSTISVLSEVATTSNYVAKLNDGLSNTGNAFIVAQLAVDIVKGDIKQLNTNLMKNLTNFGAGLINPLAGAVSFTYDYTLGELGNLLTDQQKKYWDGYKAYYVEYEAKQKEGLATRMYKELYSYYKENESHGEFDSTLLQDSIIKLVRDYCSIIWDEASVEQFDSANERALTDDLKMKITDAAYEELMSTTMQPVFAALQKRIIYDAKMEALNKMNEISDELNAVCNLNIKEINNFQGSEYKYANCIVRFDGNVGYQDDWTFQLDSKGSVSGTFKVVDYLNAYMPTVVNVYASQSDMEAGNVLKTVNCTFNTIDHKIDINLGDADNEFELTISNDQIYVGDTVAIGVNPSYEGYTYDWNVTDEKTNVVEVQFSEAGTKAVSVKVYDADSNQVAELSTELVIKASQISISCNNSNPQAKEKIIFTIASDTVFLADTETEWDFGDGNTDAGYIDTYEYWFDDPGQYTVKVNAYRYTDSGERIFVGNAQMVVNVSGDASVPTDSQTTAQQTPASTVEAGIPNISGKFVAVGTYIETEYRKVYEFNADGTCKSYAIGFYEGHPEDEITNVQEMTYSISKASSSYDYLYRIFTDNGSQSGYSGYIYAENLSNNEVVSFYTDKKYLLFNKQ